MKIETAGVGFTYLFECIAADGRVRWAIERRNLIPDQGRDYMLNAALASGSQFSNWFIGLYEGSHAPAVTDTMSTFSLDATEITTAYTEANRVALVADALAGGVFSNATTPAVFTFAQSKTVRGGFISSSAGKGSTTGILLSAVLLPSPKNVSAGESLRVTAGLSLLSV